MKKSNKKNTLKNRRSEAAKKANFTRAMRKMFLAKYGQDSYDIAEQFFRGKTTRQAAANTGLTVGKVAATYANLVRVKRFYLTAWLCNL